MFTSDQKFSRPSLAFKMQIVKFIIHKKKRKAAKMTKMTKSPQVGLFAVPSARTVSFVVNSQVFSPQFLIRNLTRVTISRELNLIRYFVLVKSKCKCRRGVNYRRDELQHIAPLVATFGENEI